jgi:hypothetical protein
MRLLVILVAAALALAGAARASDVRVATLFPVEDVSLPFWCDWGYDWDERCYREDGPHLAVGGESDKVWRSALRFSTASIPAGASIATAELSLWFDGTCIAPRKTSFRCGSRAFELGVHPIYSPSWYAEREVDSGPLIGTAAVGGYAGSQWLIWEVTDTFAEWMSGAAPNNGLLMKLVDGLEDYDSSGPLFPSSSYPDPSLRPRLTVSYVLG